MRTVRRRALNPELRWRSAGYDQQYRVTVRSEDTGETRIVYEGFRLNCRLPADLRLSPDYLSFLVVNRPADAPMARYDRWQDYTRIPRIGDDLDPEAADVMVGPTVAGASIYRLKVRDVLSQEQLVDVCDPSNVFLLPAGRIAERDTEWSVWARAHDVWHKADYWPTPRAAIEAAQARAQRLVTIDDDVRPRRKTMGVRPALTTTDLPDAPSCKTAMALVVPVTLAPVLAPSPDPAGVITSQWLDGAGGGAVERTAAMLESRGLVGWFFVDIEMGLAIDPAATKTLVGRLREGGHRIGLYIGPAVLAPRRGTRAARLTRLMGILNRLAGPGSAGVMLGEGAKRPRWMDALVASGQAGVIISRGALGTLDPTVHWRTSPFPAGPRTVAFPGTTILSTPAHARDRVTRHVLGSRDALSAGSAEAAADALAAIDGPPQLIVFEIDPLLLLRRRRGRDRAEADIWNSMIATNHPTWLQAGWNRSAKGFMVAEGPSEIQHETLNGMLDSLRRSQAPWAEWEAVFSPDRAAGWLASGAVDPLVEQRRGPRAFRPSFVRRYDDDYRLALLTS